MGTLADKARALPTTPGVYLFKDLHGTVLYVGKAVNLRARVRQYLAGSDERIMVPFLVSEAADLDVVVTATEKEALLLENTLIKQHRPRYNVKLRDDANFLHLRLDPSERWPRYRLVRAIKDDKARYFGPYASATKARRTLAWLQRLIPLRSCTDAVLRSRTRPCLLYQMGRCSAPCTGQVDQAAYAELIHESFLLLEGRRTQLVGRLRQRMESAAEELDFEEAARLRDLIASIEATLERQEVVDTRLVDRDVWGIHLEGGHGAVAVLPIRDGALGEPMVSPVRMAVASPAELLSSLINATYTSAEDLPPEVLVPWLPPDAEALEEVLSERRGRRVRIHRPKQGRKARLVRLATDNARVRYHQDTDTEVRHRRAMQSLAEHLGFLRPPHRMECFDNSNLQGTDPVAAMAVFIDGRPDRREYRRYRIKTVVGADDYASMREILDRRLRRGLDEDLLPDLIVVDGGRGQLQVALDAMDEAGVELPIIGLSKPRTEHARGELDATDKIVFPHRREPLRLPKGDPALRILQHLRDETHKHAITYHRKVRSKNALVSVLEGIPGVGAKRRNLLLKTLGSAAAVAEASVAELAAVPGIGPATASTIYEALHPHD